MSMRYLLPKVIGLILASALEMRRFLEEIL